MHMTLCSGFWSWREVFFLQDNLSAGKGQASSAPSLLKSQEIHSWESMLLPSYLWVVTRTLLDVSGLSSGEIDCILSWDSPTPSLMGGEDVYLIVLVMSESICAKLSGRAPRCPRWQQGGFEPCLAMLKNEETPSMPPAAWLQMSSSTKSKVSVHPTQDTGEQNSAGQWEVVCWWLSKNPSASYPHLLEVVLGLIKLCLE